jgi:hypothetical protein
MNIFRNFLVILMALVPMVFLLNYQQNSFFNFGNNTDQSKQMADSERQRYVKQVEAGLKDYHKTYQ